MTYRLVALDIDGTIVGPDLVISRRLKGAVADAVSAGAVVTLATGRMLRSARRFAAELGVTGPIICYQGALTADAGTGEYIRHERLEPETARAVIGLLDGIADHVSVYVGDEIYARGANEWARGYQQRMQTETHIVESLAPLAEARPTLIMAVDEPARIGALAERLRSQLGGQARITHSLPHFCEVASPGAGKAAALEALASRLGISAEETIAFGDGPGDAEMLSWAGRGVAVEDGDPETVAAAGRTAWGPDRDGVAVILEQLLDAGQIG